VKRGLDTNVLVYAHVPGFSQHPRVRRYLLSQVQQPEVTLVVTPSVLHEFVHIVTDARRFEEPVSMADALAVARIYIGRSNVECIGPDEEVVLEAFDLLERHRLGRRRLADTLFAATLLHHGVRQIITCNRRDFEIFSDLEIIDPIADS
jgi:toxin-antitoxin system PIN domain toxin